VCFIVLHDSTYNSDNNKQITSGSNRCKAHCFALACLSVNDAMTNNKTIYLVDDDAAVCHALSVFLETSGYSVRSYTSAEAFLEEANSMVQGVILLDQRMSGMTGLELQAELTRRGNTHPIIFISGCRNPQIHVDAVKAGAIGFIEKPFSNADLLERVCEAFSNT
jgi:FixJ family two-component response regulator